MIGIIANSADHETICEFFELFKTPWEYYRHGQRYRVVICANDVPSHVEANLVVMYSAGRTRADGERGSVLPARPSVPNLLEFQEDSIPVYGNILSFPGSKNILLTLKTSKECVAYLEQCGECWYARVGYDLFAEVRKLLTEGQPITQALLPTLDLHIDFLRQLIVRCGIALVEIPPVPDGFRFIVCLTHDVDHPSIRQHKCDHTMAGFLYRAIFGSFRSLLRGDITVGSLLANLAAVLKLPLVHLGLAKDFWREFGDNYLAAEGDLVSTFFVIPFKNDAGLGMTGNAPRFRASRYQARDLGDVLGTLIGAKREIGLHGIDAWRNSAKGRAELEEIRRLTTAKEIGVRMHWLYYDQQSPAVLEKSGADYDSTVGYNEAVGYRAGSTQAYKPIGVSRMLELPLHVMDTALFYGGRMALSKEQAMPILMVLVENAGRFGGCLTINWHDRSLSPERLWGDFYLEVLRELRKQGAWFATAGQAVSWFRKRRSAVFQVDSSGSSEILTRVPTAEDKLPGLCLRRHEPRAPGDAPSANRFEHCLR